MYFERGAIEESLNDDMPKPVALTNSQNRFDNLIQVDKGQSFCDELQFMVQFFECI